MPILHEVLPKYAEAGVAGLLHAVREVTEHGYLLEHIRETVTSPSALNDGQLLAYQHPNGFSKIRLATIPEYDWVVRIHVWDHSAADSDIHCHRWNFASRVLAGSLTEKIYDISDQSAGSWRKFRCRSALGVYSLDHLGSCDIALAETLVYRAGDSYQRTASTFHRASSDSNSPTVTLFIQGAAQHSATTVIRPAQAAQRNGDMPPREYQGDELQALLQSVLNIAFHA